MKIRIIVIILVALGIVTGVVFTVKEYQRAVKESVQLREDLRVVRAEKDALVEAQRQVSTAVNTNDTTTREIVKSTQVITKEINHAPITTECVKSPAIGIALERLSNSNQSTNQD